MRLVFMLLCVFVFCLQTVLVLKPKPAHAQPSPRRFIYAPCRHPGDIASETFWRQWGKPVYVILYCDGSQKDEQAYPVNWNPDA